MASESVAERLQALIGEVDALREGLLERRRSTHQPWDPAPLEACNQLLARARAVLPASIHLPTLSNEPPLGQRLWRTPTDDALAALENLRAAVATALEAAT